MAIYFVPLGISFADSHIPHGEIGNLYDFLYQLKHLKVMNYLGAVWLSSIFFYINFLYKLASNK